MRLYKKGNILVIVLIVFASVMILGIAFMTAVVSSKKNTINDINKQQAYYAAKSVLDATIKAFEEPSKAVQMSSLLKSSGDPVIGSSTFFDNNGAEWICTIEVLRSTEKSNEIILEVRATGGGGVTAFIGAVLDEIPGGAVVDSGKIFKTYQWNNGNGGGNGNGNDKGDISLSFYGDAKIKGEIDALQAGEVKIKSEGGKLEVDSIGAKNEIKIEGHGDVLVKGSLISGMANKKGIYEIEINSMGRNVEVGNISTVGDVLISALHSVSLNELIYSKEKVNVYAGKNLIVNRIEAQEISGKFSEQFIVKDKLIANTRIINGNVVNEYGQPLAIVNNEKEVKTEVNNIENKTSDNISGTHIVPLEDIKKIKKIIIEQDLAGWDDGIKIKYEYNGDDTKTYKEDGQVMVSDTTTNPGSIQSKDYKLRQGVNYIINIPEHENIDVEVRSLSIFDNSSGGYNLYINNPDGEVRFVGTFSQLVLNGSINGQSIILNQTGGLPLMFNYRPLQAMEIPPSLGDGTNRYKFKYYQKGVNK